MSKPILVRVGDIRVDPRVQRALDRGRMRRMARDWDSSRGEREALTLSRRSDGELYVVDGQHRTAAAKLAFGDDHRLWAFVYEGLDQAGEAQLFLSLNQERKAVNHLTSYQVGLVGLEPDCLAIDRVLTKMGLSMASTPSKNRVSSPTSCRRTVRLPDGEAIFERTLMVLRDAWGPDEPDRWMADLIHAVGLVFHHNNGRKPGVDDTILRKTLERRNPRQWRAASLALHGQGGSSSRQHALANMLVMGTPGGVKGYNYRRKNGAIIAPPLDARRSSDGV